MTALQDSKLPNALFEIVPYIVIWAANSSVIICIIISRVDAVSNIEPVSLRNFICKKVQLYF